MRLDNFLQSFLLAIAVAVMAFVYKEFLLRDVLHRWAKVGDRFEKNWFYKPVWGCHKCIAGQLALWIYLFTHLSKPCTNVLAATGCNINFYEYLPAAGTYSIVGHIFAICAAILFTELLNIYYNKIS